MTISIGKPAPNVYLQTTEGDFDLFDYIGDQWCVLFSYPRDFSAVCMTELGYVSSIKEKFETRDTQLLALSIAPLERHHDWSKDFPDAMGRSVNFPVVADENGDIAEQFGMVHPEHMQGVTCRCVFIMSPDKKVRFYAHYPTTVGRNFDEILRIIDSLRMSDKTNLVSPVNWQKGDKVVIPPAVPKEKADERFPEGYDTITPYLRKVEEPQ